MDQYSYISNADSAYIDELYKLYKKDRASVDSSWLKFFEGFDFSVSYNGTNGNKTAETGLSIKELQVVNLINAYRSRAHLHSKTNPVRKRKERKAYLEPENFGLNESDFDTVFMAGNEIGTGTATLRKIIETLKKIYEGHIGFEYMYIRDPEVLSWFREKIEHESLSMQPSIETKKRILAKLNEAVVFENFLHTKYVGQKRFSLEGGETTIPALDAIISQGAESGIEEIMIGMAHRGRLNILANIMGKTYEQIFNEFEGISVPDQTMGDGDVKYHLGYSSDVETESGKTVHLKLAPNPSHLEAVDPVVEGFVRAKGYHHYQADYNRIMPVLIHGDAALAGQGIVYEIAQMSKLDGYYTGGTIHFVINNQVGFTTDFDEARSSTYSTDVAKVIDAPVLHVNGDNPEAVVFAVKLAVEFRQKFHTDIYVDMVCYRKYGHNESDEPRFTQPVLYELIAKHHNPREIYKEELISRGDIDAELARQMEAEFRTMLQDRFNMVKQKPLPYIYQKSEQEWRNLRRSAPGDFEKSPETGVSQEIIDKVANSLVTLPPGFKPIKQIEKLIEERKVLFFETKQLNWAAAELLAFGSLLLDGKIVRLGGQDAQRGTFSHRHAIIRDSVTNEPYCNLNHIMENQQKCRIFNSLLSEYAALGFEYGYAMANPNALIIWEAQFGDFANGTQVIIDQFVSSAESKWRRMNGLVMLLPHGYEGQGPEHSNARPERFLQLAAEDNMVIANITLPANFFHILRRQLAWPFRKPLVIMSPKSLLRHPQCISPVTDFLSGSFKEVIEDGYVEEQSVRRLLFCSGKIYFDLYNEQQEKKRKDIAIVRVEQLYPFPMKKVQEIIRKYKNAELFWVQEEPKNMGAWGYILRLMRETRIDVISRKVSASPATGYARVHKEEQRAIISRALSPKSPLSEREGF